MIDSLLSEQIAYYRALAPDYFDCSLDDPAGAELEAALEEFRPVGDVLELACGPASWTQQLLRHVDSVTAVDASPEMLAIARRRAPAARFIEADIFAWTPNRGEHRVIKVPHDAAGLQARLDQLGWKIEVRQTSSIFYWGSGVRGA